MTLACTPSAALCVDRLSMLPLLSAAYALSWSEGTLRCPWRRLIEEADLRAAQELFGGASGSGGSKLDSMLPKSVKDFEEYAEALVNR